MGKKKQTKKETSSEWEFDNPVSDLQPTSPTGDGPRSPQDANGAASPLRRRRLGELSPKAGDGDSGGMLRSLDDGEATSPRSPVSPMSPDAFDVELDLHHNERGYKRGKLNYTIFTLVMIPLIPAYGLFALLMAWAWWVVPNPISAVAMVVSAILPWVLWLGLKGARRQSMPRLQLFSFMLMLAISLQLSLALVMILDDGTLSEAYISSVTVAFSSLCEETAALPVGADKLPIKPVCECLASDGSGSVGAGIASVSSNPDVVQCSRGVLERDLGVEGSDLVKFAVCTLLLEAGLAWLAYHMMEDLDVTAAKREAAQKGGMQMGSLRGEIVRGSGLRSAEPTAEKKKKGKGLIGWKKQQSNGGGLASRYAVLTVRTKDLFDVSRQVQRRTTDIVEDDADAEWNYQFGHVPDKEDRGTSAPKAIDIFAGSKMIEIQVFDGDKLSAADKRDKKKMKTARVPVCVGKAGEPQGNMNGVRFSESPTTRAGMLPDLDYTMDGESEVEVPMFYAGEKGGLPERAGTVTLRLQYTARPTLMARSAATLTKSWYFEFTVLGMCLLAMVALALRAPAAPPSPTLFAALRITELFIATHMVVELLLEVEGTIAAGEKFLTETWFLLALFILMCNWISILMPQESDALVQVMPAENAATDTLTQNQHLAGALANQKIRKLISVGRVFRVVRPIRTLRLVPHVDMIVSTLEDSMAIFGTVCMLIVFLLAIFALVGISSFGGALQYECLEPDANGAYTCSEEQHLAASERELKCGSDAQRSPCLLAQYLNAADGRSNIGARGSLECPVRCPLTLACAETHEWCAPLAEPMSVGMDPFGYRNFDNFGVGVLSVFVQMSGTGGLHTLPLALEAAGAASPTRGWVISCMISLMLNLVALNLFLAVCCSAYSDVACKEMEIEERIELAQEKEREEAIAMETPEETAARQEAEAIEAEENKSHQQKVTEKDWSHSCIAPIRNAAKAMVLSEMFESVTSFVIIGNTVTMAMAHEGMPEEMRYWLAALETIFLATYVIEALLKALASGKHLYLASVANRFDCFVIVCSAIGFFATFFAKELQAVIGDSGDSVGSLQVLRAVRLLRALQVVRLLHRQKALILVMRTIFKAWRPLLYHSIFCVFSMSTFAIIGMHMFGGSLGPGVGVETYADVLPEHYETFFNGLLTCFELTVGQEWSSSMWYYMRMASDAYGYPPAIVAAFFMLMYIWMSCILFSLYVAMLLQNFATLEKEKMKMQKVVYDRKAIRDEKAAARARRKLRHSLLEQTIKDDKSKGHALGKKGTKHQLHHAAATCKDMNASENKSLYIFRLDSHFRIVAATVQDHPMFKRLVMVLIMISCVSLAVEGRGEGAVGASAPEIAGHPVPKVFGIGLFSILNVLVLAAFILESGMKIVIHGLVLKSGPTTPYLGTRMNQLDFLIVVACIAAYMPFVPIEGPWARALRLGRVITPISNSLAKHPDIALVILSFFRAAPDTAIVLLPLVLLALVFSIVGVAWFGAKDRACIELGNALQPLPYDQDTCSNMTGHDWVSPSFNFDNSLNGMASLFVATTDGTHSFMLKHNVISDGVSGTAFWVFYHLVFTCFFLNLFLGVLTASFEKSSGAALTTSGEKSWSGLKRFMHTFRPESNDEDELRPGPNKRCSKILGSSVAVLWFKFRTQMFELAINKKLEKVWGAAIVANTFTLATDRFPIPQWQLEAVEFANKCFLLLCFIEVCTKLFGFGFAHFFSQGWYVSDFVLVSVSLFLRATGGQSGIEALRVVRVFRIVVLASKIPALVQLIDVLVRCLQASLAVIILTTLAMYLYSIMGMNLFGHLPTDEVLLGFEYVEDEGGGFETLRSSPTFLSDVCPACSQYADTANFLDFMSSARLLMQLVFGESVAIYVQELEYLGANYWVVLVFFASFYSLTVWVFMNLLIVTVLSNFDSASADSGSGAKGITLHDIEGFTHTWAALTIGVHQVPSVRQSGESLFERLKHTLEHHEENDDHGVESAVHEDGPPELCGQLTVTIQKVTGLEHFKDAARPYCAVTIRGTDSKGKHAEVTESRKSKNGTASWAKKKDDNPGAVLQFHATGYHTECEIDVIDSCKFGDRRLGNVLLSFGENDKLEHLRGGCRVARSAVLPLTISPDDIAKWLDEPPIGDPDRWDRFAMDGGEEDEFEEADDDPTDAMVEDDDNPAATKTEKAQQKAMEKKQRKDDKKMQKQLAKTSSRASTRGDKGQSPPDSPRSDGGSDHGLAISCPENCQEKGLKVHVKLLWEPQGSETPTKSFLADHCVRFAHQEGGCGAEGWLDVSEEGRMFKRRFCYVQSEPVAALKFYRNCQTQDELERAGVRNKLEVATVQGTNLMSICRGFTSNSMARKNRKAANFEIEFDSVRSNSTKKTLVKIGRISGTVVGAVGLSKPAGKGVQMLQLLEPMESAGVPAPFEEDELLTEGEPTDEDDGTAPLDDPDQVPNTGQARYMALKTATVRQGSAMDSMEVAQLDRYQVVTVTHTVDVEGTVRLRTRAGWVSLTGPAGRSIMVNESNRNRHYRVKREAMVGSSMKLSECSTDGGAPAATVPKGAVVEVLESQQDPETETIRHRIAGGWVSERDLKSAPPPPEISCEVEIAAWTPSAEQQEAQPLLNAATAPQQVFRTAGITDTLSPDWSEAFAVNVFASSLTLRVRVFDDASDTELGSAELSIGNNDIPGPTLTESRGSTEDEDEDMGSGVSIALPEDSFASMNVQLYQPVKKSGKAKKAAAAARAGTVQLRLLYSEIYRTEELQVLQQGAAMPGDLCTSSEMICNETKPAVWRFQAANPPIARQWCTALRWVASGCPIEERPCRLDIDLPQLLPRELTRAMHDVSLVDLPFNRTTALMNGLYHRRVMGSYKPTLRRSIYTVFQLETHAWGQSAAAGTKGGGSRSRELKGCLLRDLRGLHFHNVLERLAMLHYDKRRCLPYEEQMAEYNSEINHVALQMVQCSVALWVFRHRIGKTVGGYPWPWHRAWRSTHPATYLQATEAVAATRFRSMRILRKEIERRSRPRLMNISAARTQATSTDAPGSASSNGRSPTAGDNNGGGFFSRFRRQDGDKQKKDHGSRKEVEFGDVFGGGGLSSDLEAPASGLSEERRSEITALWGDRGPLATDGEALRVLLAQIFDEDESSYNVNPVMLGHLGAVGGALNLADLLTGLDRIAREAVTMGDDGDDDDLSDCDSDVEDIINAAEQNPGLALRRLAGDGV